MLNRRRFLSTGMLGVGLAGTSPLPMASTVKPEQPAASKTIFDEKWSKADLSGFGTPRSWWHVHQRLFPFSPERVIIVTEQTRLSLWKYKPLKERLLKQCLENNESFSEEKLDYILWIIRTLTNYYRVLQYFEQWATGLAVGESLRGFSEYSHHVGRVYQFQPGSGSQWVPTANGFVDCWLILIPGGIDLQNPWDDLPTHVIFVQVLADPACDSMLYLPWNVGLNTMLRKMPASDILAASQMDRLAAARYFNQRIQPTQIPIAHFR